MHGGLLEIWASKLAEMKHDNWFGSTKETINGVIPDWLCGIVTNKTTLITHKKSLIKYWLNAEEILDPRLCCCLWIKSPPDLGFFLQLTDFSNMFLIPCYTDFELSCGSLVG